MSVERIALIIGVLIVLAAITFVLYLRLPRRVKKSHFTSKWRDIQRLCMEQSNWPQALMLADMLLDEVLKKRRKEGKSMGERLVSAQKELSNSDAAWQAHKLANHIRHSDGIKLKEKDVKNALVAFRQALRDMEAL